MPLNSCPFFLKKNSYSKIGSKRKKNSGLEKNSIDTPLQPVLQALVFAGASISFEPNQSLQEEKCYC